MEILIGVALGLLAWFVLRFIVMGLYTVDQNERAVKTSFGRAVRVIGGRTTLDDPIAESLRPEERDRYCYPQVRVIQPGGPYFKMPWERVHKVSIATVTVNMAMDPEDPSANDRGTRLGRGERPAQHRPDRPDPIQGFRIESLCVSIWHQEAFRSRDGIFCFGSAAANRELRS